jgi:hypothetical protein
MRNFWYVRIFESGRADARRARTPDSSADRTRSRSDRQWTPPPDALVASLPNITMTFAHRPSTMSGSSLRLMQRLGSDYVRFVQPRYASAPILRDRARDRVPGQFERSPTTKESVTTGCGRF